MVLLLKHKLTIKEIRGGSLLETRNRILVERGIEGWMIC